MTDRSQARKRFVKVLKTLKNEARVKRKLKELKKKHGDINREDFVWHYILQNFATWGGASGWQGLINNSRNYNKVTFEALSEKRSSSQRLSVLRTTLRKAKVHWPNKKPILLAQNFDRISKEWKTLEAVRNALLRSCRKITYPIRSMLMSGELAQGSEERASPMD